ncbi:ADP-ribosyltransferase [Pedobacter frigiditerrae]|uniref:ADP-ribosyltransferase n=1 Tax=Pedobacter frigiditerrae TaxID=2530452 RepID=UPI0013F15970|nr:ADP-ribosyltransferase [Pedobacter frigiditerrae]
MKKAEEYAKKYLAEEIKEIENTTRINHLLNLSVFEKASILKYTNDGYEDLNEYLRKTEGKEKTDFGKIIDQSLSKLDNYNGLVYRCATLSKKELQLYKNAFELAKPIVEHTFLSTSKSKTIAYMFGKNTIFRIYSRTGKDIEKIAKFGSDHPQNEQEVLFRTGSAFDILDISKEGSRTLITMEERK